MGTYQSYDYRPVVEFCDYNDNGHKYIRPIEVEEVAEWDKIVDEDGGEPEKMFWTVYGHKHADGCCDAIADFTTEDMAKEITKSLNESLLGNRYISDCTVAVMDELTCRDKSDAALTALINYRDENGTSAWRDAIAGFTMNTELYFESMDEDDREHLFAVVEWDFEWIGRVIDRLYETGLHAWWSASIEQIKDASKFIYQDALDTYYMEG